jgi:hypothetical protein
MVISLTTRTTRFHFVIINIWAYQSYLVVGVACDSAGCEILKNRQSDFLFIPPCNKACGCFGEYALFQSKINDDHLYRDPEYSWDAYIQA